MKERKKDYRTSKSVAHPWITREIRSQSQSHRCRSALGAVLEDTMHLVDLFLSAFAPSWIAKGSLDLDNDRTSGRAGTWPAVRGALRAITVEAENARSRVLAGPRDCGHHFVLKCFHCACSVSHERGPNARSYVKSPTPPPHPQQNRVTLLRIHSGNFFLKACPEMNLLTKLWFPLNHA